jgi:hypothetical protein
MYYIHVTWGGDIFSPMDNFTQSQIIPFETALATLKSCGNVAIIWQRCNHLATFQSCGNPARSFLPLHRLSWFNRVFCLTFTFALIRQFASVPVFFLENQKKMFASVFNNQTIGQAYKNVKNVIDDKFLWGLRLKHGSIFSSAPVI